MSKLSPYATEADLVAAFCAAVERLNRVSECSRAPVWRVYHETAGWDLLLVDQDGVQIGVEAKLTLNAKVLDQALPHPYDDYGPDYRAVLVPRVGLQRHLHRLARHVGLTVIDMSVYGTGWGVAHQFHPYLPRENAGESFWMEGWHSWLPAKRCPLPDYIPDVTGGKAAPVKLTDWKVRAIKLVILLDRRGYVTRHDMKLLGLSPTRWTDAYYGFLPPDPIKGGYVRNSRTPDFKAQHPVNYAQIEADFDQWAPPDMGVAA